MASDPFGDERREHETRFRKSCILLCSNHHPLFSDFVTELMLLLFLFPPLFTHTERLHLHHPIHWASFSFALFDVSFYLLVWFLSFHELRENETEERYVCKKGWMTEEQKRRKIYNIIFWANLIQYFLPCFHPSSHSWLFFLPLFLFLAWMKLQFSFRSADDLMTGMQQEKEQKRHKTDNRKTRIEGGERMKRGEEHPIFGWLT